MKRSRRLAIKKAGGDDAPGTEGRMTHGEGGEYKDLVVFLAAAGVVVPLFNRIKISPVLGFLEIGRAHV
jgi:hypothetical protein